MKIKNLIGELSGSMADITASRNRYGFHLRQRSTPTQPRTPAQTSQWEALAGFADAWSNVLDDQQRESWADLSNRITFKDSQGTVFKLQPNDLYIAVNLRRYTCGDVALDVAPLNQNVRPIAMAEISAADAGETSIELDFTPAASATEKILVKGVANVNPGVSFVENQLRVWEVSPSSQVAPWIVNLPAGSPVLIEGAKVVVTVFRYDGITGAYSPGFKVVAVVAPPGP